MGMGSLGFQREVQSVGGRLTRNHVAGMVEIASTRSKQS